MLDSQMDVRLPNVCSTIATMERDGHLTNELVLRNVLFVPKFHYHLIYISHMLYDNDWHVQFTSTLCAIQDRLSGTLIGAGEQRGEALLLSQGGCVAGNWCSWFEYF